MRCFCECYSFVTSLPLPNEDFERRNKRWYADVRCRARNPRFWMPHFGQKTGFRARNAGMNEIKSGIPCSGSMDFSRLWVHRSGQRCGWFKDNRHIWPERCTHPCLKQHFQDLPWKLPTPDWAMTYDVSCILGSMLYSLMGLPNPAWVSLGNVVSHVVADAGCSYGQSQGCCHWLRRRDE